jgi:hypothetical protein
VHGGSTRTPHPLEHPSARGDAHPQPPTDALTRPQSHLGTTLPLSGSAIRVAVTTAHAHRPAHSPATDRMAAVLDAGNSNREVEDAARDLGTKGPNDLISLMHSAFPTACTITAHDAGKQITSLSMDQEMPRKIDAAVYVNPGSPSPAVDSPAEPTPEPTPIRSERTPDDQTGPCKPRQRRAGVVPY